MEDKHYGVYQCRASNSAGADIAQIWIKTDGRQFAKIFSFSPIFGFSFLYLLVHLKDKKNSFSLFSFPDGKFSDDVQNNRKLIIVSKPENKTVAAGKDVTFECKTEDPHNTQLLWTYNGEII